MGTIDLSSYKPVAGTETDAPQIASGFDVIQAVINGNLDENNLKSTGKIINLARLMQGGAATNQGMIWNGTDWVAAASLQSLLTATGDIPYASAANTPARRAIGSTGDVLTVAGGVPTWAAPGATTLVSPALVAPLVGRVRSAAVVTANTAYLFPLPIASAEVVFTRFIWAIATSSGNLDFGVYYSDDESTFTRLVSLGSTASPGTGVRTFTVGSTTITPVTGRRWFVAAAANNTTVAGDQLSDCNPAFSKATSFPLPSSLTGMTAIVADTPGPFAVLGV